MFPWGSFLVYALSTAITPGPNNLMSLSEASRLGFKRALPFNLGIWLGFSLVMLLCAWLSQTLHSLLPAIQTPMKVVGALYMLYLAYKTFTSGDELGHKESSGGFLKGALLQFVNPKIILYGIISMQVFILPYYQGAGGIALFALLLAFIGFACTLCWSAFGSAFRLLFSKYAKVTNSLMAALLVYCAISLFL